MRNGIVRLIGATILAGTTMLAGCGVENPHAPESVQPPGERFLEDIGTPEDEARLDSEPQGELEARSSLTIACGVANAVQGLSDSTATEWEVHPGASNLLSSGTYSMFETYNKSYVKYGDRRWGINLVWSGTAPGGFKIEKAGGGTINYGDKVAMKFDGGGYVKYERRRWGINLVWSSSPVYEWEVRGGTTGTAAPSGAKIRFFNGTVNDNLVYCRRPTGINLGWAADCTDVPGVGRLRTGYCP